MWQQYRGEGRRWPFYWFAINAVLYCAPSVVLGLVLLDREWFFVTLSVCLTFGMLVLAWRVADERIGILWWAMLLGVMALCCGYMTAVVFWPEGDTPICYDRVSQSHFRGPLVNRGPDPMCQGIPLQNL